MIFHDKSCSNLTRNLKHGVDSGTIPLQQR